MGYFVRSECLRVPFFMPCNVVDKHIKLASEAQLKTLLYVMRHHTEAIEASIIAKAIGLPDSEVEDALFFWAQAQILDCDEPMCAKKEREKAVLLGEKPSRADVIRRGDEDNMIKLMLHEAQLKFGRNLKTNESRTLVWLYDDQGMDVSVILMLLQYAVSEGRINIGFIEKTAVKWLDSGIETVADAERYVAELSKKKLCWAVVEQAFGRVKKAPSDKDYDLALLWVDEWKLSVELMQYAYNTYIEQRTKFSMAGVADLLADWHRRGITTPAAAAADGKRNPSKKIPAKSAGKKYDFAAYDLELFEKMLDSDD